eukprot:CAMPEP_0178661478 /NCGR_PEP_ID=MMETSP0698-20121128/27716_1 /TAXON_ID=265572 /ORGANISM="Extubocellulus spinifer, Strain CCMP396" /LENGTH=62 /DNA_ID=CAMNT_0020304277 /DNA_START=1 /DNA_END=186 /DNA_ORIENTATION=-
MSSTCSSGSPYQMPKCPTLGMTTNSDPSICSDALLAYLSLHIVSSPAATSDTGTFMLATWLS